ATPTPLTHSGEAVASSSTPSAGSWSGMYASVRSPSSTRNPTVGPGWLMRFADTVAGPIRHSSGGTSWKVGFDGSSRRCTGNSGTPTRWPSRLAVLAFPEHGDRADELVRMGEQGERRSGEAAAHAVARPDAEHAVRRLPLDDRHGERKVLEGDLVALVVARPE